MLFSFLCFFLGLQVSLRFDCCTWLEQLQVKLLFYIVYVYWFKSIVMFLLLQIERGSCVGLQILLPDLLGLIRQYLGSRPE